MPEIEVLTDETLCSLSFVGSSFPPCVESSHYALTNLMLVFLRFVDHSLFLSGKLMVGLMDSLSLIRQWSKVSPILQCHNLTPLLA